MNITKKLFCLLLALIMVIGLLPLQVFAQETMVSEALESLDISWKNPFIPEELLPEHAEVVRPNIEPRANVTYTDSYDAGTVMRDAMIARQTSFSLHFHMHYSPDWDSEILTGQLSNELDIIIANALAHGSNPAGGDYLNFHFMEVQLDDIRIDKTQSNRMYFTADFVASYLTNIAQEQAVNKAVNELINKLGLNSMDTDYERVRAVYDWMADNIYYDVEGLNDPDDLVKYSAYGAIIEKSAVCQGYASLFYRIMCEIDIDVRVISGDAYNGETVEPHAWNIVELDGLYYNVDNTWDAIFHQAGLDYEYFLKCDSSFSDHFRDDRCNTTQFYNEYPMSSKDYEIPTQPALFEIGYANMTLGNSLAMNFAFAQSHRDDWSGCYAQVVKEYVDGRPDKVVNIPYANWSKVGIGGVSHWLVTFPGVAAKEMMDAVHVTIYDAGGNAISKVWNDSVQSYALRVLDNPSTNRETKIMIVDLLNYGTAAQNFFDYGSDFPANFWLTNSELSMATPEAKAKDSRVVGPNYLGTNLGLESQILMRMAFTGTNQSMYATIEFTNHAGRKISETVPGSVFGASGVIVIDDIVIADGRIPVTVTVYNADGSVYSYATDSLESYIARMNNADELYEMILKFSDSAYNFFH